MKKFKQFSLEVFATIWEKKYFFIIKKKIKFKKIFSKKGQVNQRIKAIKYSTKKYIIQLDDDINLKKNCIENLYKAIKKNNSEKKVFGPQIVDIHDKKNKAK